MTTPGDFEKFFGEVPWGFRRNEDGSRSLDDYGKAVKSLGVSIMKEITSLRKDGHDDAYISGYLAAMIIAGMQFENTVEAPHGR